MHGATIKIIQISVQNMKRNGDPMCGVTPSYDTSPLLDFCLIYKAHFPAFYCAETEVFSVSTLFALLVRACVHH